MKRLARWAALLAALAAASSHCLAGPASGAPEVPSQAAPEDGLRVGAIRIDSLDVFTEEEATKGWVYRAANTIHIETRVSVIRSFLLFKEGDPYDPNRLTETERNLRNLPFIKSASVLAHPPKDGVVDVDVRTQDAWTTQPGISLGKKGGVTTYSFALEEKDLLGLGRQISLRYGQDVQRIIRSIQYKDPCLFGPYWSTEAIYANNSDGDQKGIRINRPFYSFLTPWAADLIALRTTQDDKIYTQGVESSIFRGDHRDYQVAYGRALSANDIRARRLFAGFQAAEDVFDHRADRPDDVIPDDRNFRYLFVRYEDVGSDFLKVNYVNRDSRFEDINLATGFSVTLGVSPKALGLDRTTGLARFGGSSGWRLSQSSFVLAGLSYETRFDSGPKNEILSGSATYVRKFGTLPLQTFVTHLEFDLGWNLDRDVQFFADGGNGLRGYRLYSFEGNRRVIWNVEHRIFSGKEILQLASFGAVAFFDTGTAVPEGRPLTLSEFKSDVGVGIRVAVSRAAGNPILRVDFAYALNPDPFGRKGWLVSFSSGQVF
jgi:outer membrane protein assembly factor BamA